MENSIKLYNNEMTRMNESTGLMVSPNNEFLAKSGFKYISGVRSFGDLNIVEEVASGTAVNYLCAVRVYDKAGVLLIDRKVEKGTYYEREKARNIAKEALLKILEDANANNPDFDLLKAHDAVDQHLKSGYYSQSYAAVNEWYNNLLNQMY